MNKENSLMQSYLDDLVRVSAVIPDVSDLFHQSILITGASGMIGSTVAEILLSLNATRHADICILLAGRSREKIKKRFGSFLEGKEYHFVEYDATQCEHFNVTADYIIHGACSAHPSAYGKQPVETMLSNILGLNRLLEVAATSNVKRVLFLSSGEVYGKNMDCEEYSESDYAYVDILNPRAAYPCSKRAAETLCIAYGKEHGVDTVIVRPGHIYGPSITEEDSRASSSFFKNGARRENLIIKSEGNQRRSYCYTLDCASAILTVLLKGKKGTAYNISDRNCIVSIREMADRIAEKAGVKVQFTQPSLKEKSSYNLMDHSVLDASKLESLGWRAIFSLDEGIGRTLMYLPIIEKSCNC